MKLYILASLILITACSSSDRAEVLPETPPRALNYTSEVQFLSHGGSQVISTVKVAVADDDPSRSEGLMNVYQMPSDSGMIFIFDDNEPRSFWMANTPLSLDIIFVNSDFEIVRIHRNAQPYSHEQIRSDSPAKYVVEVNAGYAMRHDITEGMKISYSEGVSDPGS